MTITNDQLYWVKRKVQRDYQDPRPHNALERMRFKEQYEDGLRFVGFTGLEHTAKLEEIVEDSMLDDTVLAMKIRFPEDPWKNTQN